MLLLYLGSITICYSIKACYSKRDRTMTRGSGNIYEMLSPNLTNENREIKFKISELY